MPVYGNLANAAADMLRETEAEIVLIEQFLRETERLGWPRRPEEGLRRGRQASDGD
jgi:hypothetical protein